MQSIDTNDTDEEDINNNTNLWKEYISRISSILYHLSIQQSNNNNNKLHGEHEMGEGKLKIRLFCEVLRNK